MPVEISEATIICCRYRGNAKETMDGVLGNQFFGNNTGAENLMKEEVCTCVKVRESTKRFQTAIRGSLLGGWIDGNLSQRALILLKEMIYPEEERTQLCQSKKEHKKQ